MYQATNSKPQPLQDENVANAFEKYYVGADNGFKDDHYIFSEDCLYLNVYTTNPYKQANLPVWLFYLGCNFVFSIQLYLIAKEIPINT